MTTKTNFSRIDGVTLSKHKLPKGKAYPISSTAFHDLLKSCDIQPIHGFFMYDNKSQQHEIISIDYEAHSLLEREPGFDVWINAVDSTIKLKANKAITHYYSSHVRSWWDKLKATDISSIIHSHTIELILHQEIFKIVVTEGRKKQTVWELPADRILDA